MATHNINIDSQLVVQTAAQWAADSTVYSNKRMLLTSDVFYTGTDQPRFKFGDGVQTWANLDYIPEGGGGTDMVVYSYFNTNSTTLADLQDYFLGQMGALGGTVNAFAHIPIKGGTLREVYIQTYNGSTFGTNEGVTVTLFTNGGADSYEITTGLTYDARHTNQSFTGLSETIVDGASYLVLDTPTFATNPTSAQTRVTLIVEL